MMTSEKQMAANRRNAQLSTGPRKTSDTRLNALTHGILSKEAFISIGEAAEDREQFNQLDAELREDLGPMGALEELLVDTLIMLVWRMRRAIQYETAAIGVWSYTHGSDSGTTYRDGKEPLFGLLRTETPSQSVDQLTGKVADIERTLRALKESNPLGLGADFSVSIMKEAEYRFGVRIEEVLDLEDDWDSYEEFNREQVDMVLAASYPDYAGNVELFWQAMEEDLNEDLTAANRELIRQRIVLALQRSLARLPDQQTLEKVQRYHGYLSREFFRTLHELQRIQLGRSGREPVAPLAVDVIIEGEASLGPLANS